MVNIGCMCVFHCKGKCVGLSHNQEIRHCVFREVCINGGCMHCELRAVAFVEASMFRGGAAGDTMWVIEVVAFAGGVWSGTVRVPLCIYTVLIYMTVFLTLVASDEFLSILDDDYPRI